MKKILKFGFIFFGILMLSAVLAPLLADFLPYDFDRIFNRLIMIFTLLSVFIFVRVRVSGFQQYGLERAPDAVPQVVRGFLLGVLILVVLQVFLALFGEVTWGPDPLTWGQQGWRFVKCLFSALLIGVIEEFFFRGFIFRTVRDRFKWPLLLSILGTNSFYAILHFLNHKEPCCIGADPNFYDSLKLITAPFLSLLDWKAIWPGAVGLLIFGITLNDLAIRTRNLYAAIGLHAGCVFWIKFDGKLVDFTTVGSLLLGSDKMYDGIVGWLFLLLLFWISRWMIPSVQENKECVYVSTT